MLSKAYIVMAALLIVAAMIPRVSAGLVINNPTAAATLSMDATATTAMETIRATTTRVGSSYQMGGSRNGLDINPHNKGKYRDRYHSNPFSKGKLGPRMPPDQPNYAPVLDADGKVVVAGKVFDTAEEAKVVDSMTGTKDVTAEGARAFSGTLTGSGMGTLQRIAHKVTKIIKDIWTEAAIANARMHDMQMANRTLFIPSRIAPHLSFPMPMAMNETGKRVLIEKIDIETETDVEEIEDVE